MTGGAAPETPSPGAGATAAPDPARLTAGADRLRMVMIRLRRQLHQQDTPGLSVALYSALATVVKRGELSIGDLAEAEHLPPSAVTRIVDRLEEAGLVTRQPNPLDRRGGNIRPTPAGGDLMDERRRTSNLWLARRLARLTPEQRGVVDRALDLLEGVVLQDLGPWELPAAGPAGAGTQPSPGAATP